MDDQEKTETRLFRKEVRDGLKCLKDGFMDHKEKDEKWKAEFEPYLKAELQAKEEWSGFWREKKKQLLSRGADAGFLAIVGLLIYNAGAYVKSFIKALL